MNRFLLDLRALVEGMIGFWLLVSMPFVAVDIIRGTSPTGYMLASVLSSQSSSCS
jgi:hypothetical protein